MPLAIFDLDDTLIAGDSASLWLRFLVQEGLADPDMLPREEEMMRAYHHGSLEMDDYMRFTLQPLAGRSVDEVAEWAARFIDREISSLVYPQARKAVASYQRDGWRCLVISATGEHVVAPIARSLGIDEVLAIQLEIAGRHYTGSTTGILTFKQGKVESMNGSHGYSDSGNDIPLLETVTHAFTVNPDARLNAHAVAARWYRLNWTRE